MFNLCTLISFMWNFAFLQNGRSMLSVIDALDTLSQSWAFAPLFATTKLSHGAKRRKHSGENVQRVRTNGANSRATSKHYNIWWEGHVSRFSCKLWPLAAQSRWVQLWGPAIMGGGGGVARKNKNMAHAQLFRTLYGKVNPLVSRDHALYSEYYVPDCTTASLWSLFPVWSIWCRH